MEQAACDARFQGRLHGFGVIAAQALHFNTEAVEYRRMMPLVSRPLCGRAIGIEHAVLGKFAIEFFVAHQLAQQMARALQDGQPAGGGVVEVTPVAAPRKTQQPAQAWTVEARIEIERRIGCEHRTQRHADHPRHRQRRRVTGRDGAAIAVRTAAAGRALLQYPHARAGLEQIQRARQSDDASAKNQHIAARIIHGRSLPSRLRLNLMFSNAPNNDPQTAPARRRHA